MGLYSVRMPEIQTVVAAWCTVLACLALFPNATMAQSTQPEQTVHPVCLPSLDVPRAEAVGLAMSGGGYRAMLFHLGALWRLYETGQLARLHRITSVSGGSIVSALLGTRWNELDVDDPDPDRFISLIVTPVRELASRTIDVGSILKGIFLPGTVNSKLERAYEKYVYGSRTLQVLPVTPQFEFMSTNLESGVMFRFSKRHAGDFRIGLIPDPTITLAKAVASSSAFPPFLSPSVMRSGADNFSAADFQPCPGADLHSQLAYHERVELSDGGVYDNMGLERINDFGTILISNGGGRLPDDSNPPNNWISQSVRVGFVVDRQVRALRAGTTIRAALDDEKPFAYWDMRIDLETAIPELRGIFTAEQQLELANVTTRLRSIPVEQQTQLINLGYVVADTRLRLSVATNLPHPDGPPYR